MAPTALLVVSHGTLLLAAMVIRANKAMQPIRLRSRLMAVVVRRGQVHEDHRQSPRTPIDRATLMAYVMTYP